MKNPKKSFWVLPETIMGLGLVKTPIESTYTKEITTMIQGTIQTKSLHQ